MSTHSGPASGDSSAHALKERLARLEQDLIRQRKRVDGSTTLTTIVGIIALLAIGGFFYYGYKEVSIFKDPNKIVDYGQALLDDNIPQLRARLEGEITKSAPEWAATLSKEALGSLPVARRRLEKIALDYTDEALKESRRVTAEKFQDYFKSHHKELEKAFEELAKSPNLAENSLLDLQVGLEKDLKVDMKADAEVLLRELTKANRIFKRMKEGRELNQEDQIGRQAWMLARAISQHDRLDLGSTGLPDISANGKPDRTAGKIAPISASEVKPPKKPPLGGKIGAEQKDAPKSDSKKDQPPDDGKKEVEKKKDDSDKKKDADSDKKKDTSTAKPENK
jgi:hypothetical protein